MPTVTRVDYIRRIAAHNFWTDMARKPEDREPLAQDAALSLLLSCLVNRGIPWERAMGSGDTLGLVDEVKLRSGCDDTLELFASHTPSMLEFLIFDDDGDYADRGGRNGSLHRYRYLAEYLYLAACRVRDVYDGDARNIWRGEPTGGMLQDTLLEFRGVGAKIAAMTIRILVLSHGVVLWNGYSGMDISVDRHIRRVMTRLGLVGEDATPQDIINKARELSPYAPCEWEGLFLTGLDVCFAKNPRCSECSLARVCRSAR